MKKNSRLEQRRKVVPGDVKIFVEDSYDIAGRILQILKDKNIDQKFLAKSLGKSESEISKWMTGSHNFTLRTLSKIQFILNERLYVVCNDEFHKKDDITHKLLNIKMLMPLTTGSVNSHVEKVTFSKTAYSKSYITEPVNLLTTEIANVDIF